MIKNIEITKLYPHSDNPRKSLGDLTELAESIKAKGILQNLTVVPRTPAQDEYTVVIGHRRLAAAKLAGLTEVPCVVVDMTPQEQIAAMLLENIQRSDLTVYEQAQGIQMMLDLGESVGSISEKTGFSETTVRRRMKLLELDQEKLKASAERGATLMDFYELEKIKDINLRNSVLEEIGTPNFRWKLQQAIDKEKHDENLALIIAELEKFATKIESSDASFKYVDTYCVSWDRKVTVPEDAGTVEYFYTVSGGYCTLYKKREQTQEDVAVEEKQDKTREIRAALEELSNRAYQLRSDFVSEISNATAKKHINVIIEYLLSVMLQEYSFFDIDCKMLAEFMGIEISKDEEWEFNNLADYIRTQPERYLLVVTYLALDSGGEHYYNWDGSHDDNESLNKIYAFLGRLGYQELFQSSE